ncbi:MAG: hypothetical protein NC930_00375 [Candidatus Omnitrophica bacterium]|nr:hypothetical protein [Candidatus Omnitrophota bacterium]
MLTKPFNRSFAVLIAITMSVTQVIPYGWTNLSRSVEEITTSVPVTDEFTVEDQNSTAAVQETSVDFLNNEGESPLLAATSVQSVAIVTSTPTSQYVTEEDNTPTSHSVYITEKTYSLPTLGPVPVDGPKKSSTTTVTHPNTILEEPLPTTTFGPSDVPAEPSPTTSPAMPMTALEYYYQKLKRFDSDLSGIAADCVTWEQVMASRTILEELREVIELIIGNGETPTEEILKEFKTRCDRFDQMLTNKPMDINGVEVLPSEAMRVVAEELTRLSGGDALDYSRLPGIRSLIEKGRLTLEDLETLQEYLQFRQVGVQTSIPVFKVLSSYGNLVLIYRLVTAFGDKVIGGDLDLDGKKELNMNVFRRMVNGTQEAYEKAEALIRQIKEAHAISLPAVGTIAYGELVAYVGQVDSFREDLKIELLALIETFTVEQSFKSQLTSEISQCVNQIYSPYVTRLQDLMWRSSVQFQVSGVGAVTMTSNDLYDLVSFLPRDIPTLLKYPGLKEIGEEFLRTLEKQHIESQRNYIHLYDGNISETPDTLSSFAIRFQLAQKFLETYGSTVVVNGIVDREAWRNALLMNDYLRQLLDSAKSVIAAAIGRAQTIGANVSSGITIEVYDSLFQLIKDTNEAVIGILKLALDDVIYDVRSEVTMRLQERFNALLSHIDGIIASAKIKVVIDGRDQTLDPKALHAEIKKVLKRVAVIWDDCGDYSKIQYDRLQGITEEILIGLKTAYELNYYRYVNFNSYQPTFSQDMNQTMANEEVWFRMIPRVLSQLGTIILDSDGKFSVEKFQEALLDGVYAPVPAGQSINQAFREILQRLIPEGISNINALDSAKWEDRIQIKGVVEDILKRIGQEALPLIKELNHSELSILNRVGNWGSYPYSIPRISDLWNLVDQKLQNQLVTVSMIDGNRVQIDLAAVIRIPGFPRYADYDKVLFPGISASDFEGTAEKPRIWLDLNEGIQNPTYGYQSINPEILTVNIVSRLYETLSAIPEIYRGKLFVDGKLNVEILRRYLKNVDGLHQAILETVRQMTNEELEKLQGLKTVSVTIESIQAVYQSILETRTKIINYMESLTSRHEREDVLGVEKDATKIYQELVAEMIQYIRTNPLVLVYEGQEIVIPAGDIAARILKTLEEKFPGEDLGAHHFASLYGFNIEDLRRYNKLEEFLGMQLIALPRNSQFVEVLSKLSEIGIMELIVDAVNRNAGEVIDPVNKAVNVNLLMDILTDSERAVETAKNRATQIADEAKNALTNLDGPMTSEKFFKLASIIDNAKYNLVTVINHYLTGFTQEMFDQVQAHVTGLYAELKTIRDSMVTSGDIEITAFDGSIFKINLTQLEPAVVDRIMQILAAMPPQPDPDPIWPRPWPVYSFKAARGVVLKSETAIAMEEPTLIEPVGPIVIDPIRPWPPIWDPSPGKFDRTNVLTEFGFCQLLVNLAVKYGSFVVDENGDFSVEKFLYELGRTDIERAKERFEILKNEAIAELSRLVSSDPSVTVSLDDVSAVHVYLNRSRELFLNTLNHFLNNGHYKERYQLMNLGNEAWDAVVSKYEELLFAKVIKFEMDGRTVSFAGKVLLGILKEEYNKGNTALVNLYKEGQETTWEYQQNFKTLYNNWWYRGPYYDYGIAEISDQAVSLTDEGTDDIQDVVYPFTLGELERIPGIYRADLVNLDVVSKDKVQLTFNADPKELLKGLFNMRIVSPDAAVQTIGLATADISASGSVKSAMSESVSLSRVASNSLRYEGDRDRVMIARGYLYVSDRSILFNMLPAMVKDFVGTIVGEDGVVDPELFRALLSDPDAVCKIEKDRVLKSLQSQIEAFRAALQSGNPDLQAMGLTGIVERDQKYPDVWPGTYSLVVYEPRLYRWIYDHVDAATNRLQVDAVTEELVTALELSKGEILKLEIEALIKRVPHIRYQLPSDKIYPILLQEEKMVACVSDKGGCVIPIPVPPIPSQYDWSSLVGRTVNLSQAMVSFKVENGKVKGFVSAVAGVTALTYPDQAQDLLLHSEEAREAKRLREAYINEFINPELPHPVRALLQNDLMTSFGFDKGKLAEFIKQGLVKFEFDLANATAQVLIDPSVKLEDILSGAVSLVDPLGIRELPREIRYQFGEGPMYKCAQGAKCFPGLRQYFLISGEYVQGDQRVEMDFLGCTHEGDLTTCPVVGDNRLHSVKVWNIPTPCEGLICPTVESTHAKAKEITYEYYEESSTGSVASISINRQVVVAHIMYSPLGSIWQDVVVTDFGDRKLRIEKIHDIRYGAVIATSEFVYLVAMTMIGCPPEDTQCVWQPPTILLSHIARKDANGNPLSETVKVQLSPLEIYPLVYQAKVFIPNRDEDSNGADIVTFGSWDGLLDKVRKLEEEQDHIETLRAELHARTDAALAEAQTELVRYQQLLAEADAAATAEVEKIFADVDAGKIGLGSLLAQLDHLLTAGILPQELVERIHAYKDRVNVLLDQNSSENIDALAALYTDAVYDSMTLSYAAKVYSWEQYVDALTVYRESVANAVTLEKLQNLEVEFPQVHELAVVPPVLPEDPRVILQMYVAEGELLLEEACANELKTRVVTAVNAKLEEYFDGKLSFDATGNPEQSKFSSLDWWIVGNIVDGESRKLIEGFEVDFQVDAEGKITLINDYLERLRIPQEDADALTAQLAVHENPPVALDLAMVLNPQGMGIGGEVVYDHLYRFVAVAEGRITLYYWQEVRQTDQAVEMTLGSQSGTAGRDLVTLTFVVGARPSVPEIGVIYLELGQTYDLVLQRGGAGVEVAYHNYQWLTPDEIWMYPSVFDANALTLLPADLSIKKVSGNTNPAWSKLPGYGNFFWTSEDTLRVLPNTVTARQCYMGLEMTSGDLIDFVNQDRLVFALKAPKGLRNDAKLRVVIKDQQGQSRSSDIFLARNGKFQNYTVRLFGINAREIVSIVILFMEELLGKIKRLPFDIRIAKRPPDIVAEAFNQEVLTVLPVATSLQVLTGNTEPEKPAGIGRMAPTEDGVQLVVNTQPSASSYVGVEIKIPTDASQSGSGDKLTFALKGPATPLKNPFVYVAVEDQDGTVSKYLMRLDDSGSFRNYSIPRSKSRNKPVAIRLWWKKTGKQKFELKFGRDRFSESPVNILSSLEIKSESGASVINELGNGNPAGIINAVFSVASGNKNSNGNSHSSQQG